MAFEHVTHVARRARLERMRAYFLDDPTNYREDGVNWADLLYPNNTIHVASPGPTLPGDTIRDGSIEKPFRVNDLNQPQYRRYLTPFQRIVYTGIFTGNSGQFRPLYDNVTLDLRGDRGIGLNEQGESNSFVEGGSILTPGNRHGHVGLSTTTTTRPYEPDAGRTDLSDPNNPRYVYFIQETIFSQTDADAATAAASAAASELAGHPVTVTRTLASSINMSTAYWQVVVDGVPFRGHSGAHTPKGVISIIGDESGSGAPTYRTTDYSGAIASAYSILIRTPWAYEVDDVIDISCDRIKWPNGVYGFAGLVPRQPYYVVWAGVYGRKDGETPNINTGYQRIKISATLGGDPIEFTPEQVSGTQAAPGFEPAYSGGLYPTRPAFFNQFPPTITRNAIHPEKDNLQPDEFFVDTIAGRLYFCTDYPLSSPDDPYALYEGSMVFVTSSPNSSAVAINGQRGVNVLGGQLIASFRSVFVDSQQSGATIIRQAQDNGMWGTRAIGSYRGFCIQTSPARTKTRFCEVYRSKYAFASEEFTSAESETSHRYFIAADCATYLHNWGDRQALMLNPASDHSEYIFGLVENCGIDKFPDGFSFPANQLDGINAQWGAMTNDAASHLTFRGVYFYGCYGPFFKNWCTTTAPGQTNVYGVNDDHLIVDGVAIEDCIFDARPNAPSRAHNASPMMTHPQAGAVAGWYPSGMLNISIQRNLCLMGSDTENFRQWDGTKVAATLHVAISRDLSPVEVLLRDNIVYGGGGAQSTIHLNEERTSLSAGTNIAIDSDFNTYCCPAVEYMAINVSRDSSKPEVWSAPGLLVPNTSYIESLVAMTATPGPAPTWTSGAVTNEGNSVVLSEEQITALGKTYSAWGEPMSEAIKQPWFMRPLPV